MKLSIYFYLFNAQIRQFDLDTCINNFCEFADEVICATIPSEDETLSLLKKHEKEKGADRFKVVETNISLSNNRFDGDLKTAALRACKQEADRLYCIADADERFVKSNKDKWERWSSILLTAPLDGLLIPVIDLFGAEDTIRSDRDIGQKFRLHKNTVKSRGVIPQAEVAGGFINTKMSDTTEPLDTFGRLANFQSVVYPYQLLPAISMELVKGPYCLHLGSLSLERRAKINKEFWQAKWQDRSKSTINDIATDVRELQSAKTQKHGLPLE